MWESVCIDAFLAFPADQKSMVFVQLNIQPLAHTGLNYIIRILHQRTFSYSVLFSLLSLSNN